LLVPLEDGSERLSGWLGGPDRYGGVLSLPVEDTGWPGGPGKNTESLEELLLAGAGETGGVCLMTPLGEDDGA
jgi:hypothetical protein